MSIDLNQETVLRLIETINYLVGIAERGEGRTIRDDETPEMFVLGYVKKVESALDALWLWTEAEAEHFNGATPDDHICEMVRAARPNA